MNRFSLLLLSFLFNVAFAFGKTERFISLAGIWSYRIDSLSVGESENWAGTEFEDQIKIPGTTDDKGIGDTFPIFKSVLGSRPFADYPKNADFGMMTRKHKYIGKVWYQCRFRVHADQVGIFRLFMERVMWRSRVWLNGVEVDKANDNLSSPHIHHLGYLQEGDYLLTVMVDNSEIYPIGNLAHSYCPHMQTQWNGMLGSVGLYVASDIVLDQVKVVPSFKEASVEIVSEFLPSEKDDVVKIKYCISDLQTKKVIKKHQDKIIVSDADYRHTVKLPVKNPKEWNEFTPNLYELVVSINGIETKKIQFGFRDLGVEDKHFTINGKKIIYRNSHEGMFFGKTGYPEMSLSYWMDIFSLYKKHGFNAVRFHSSCPPEAAFEAADRLGLYLQVEFFWMDGWMGYPDLIGENNDALNTYVVREMRHALQCYGNHPSMMLVAFGNELGGDFDWMGERIKTFKQEFPNQFFAAGIAHNVTVHDDFVEYGGKQKIWNYVGTDWDYSDSYSVANAHPYDPEFRRKDLPEFTHETGQYIVHPLWSEIEEYQGLLLPENLLYYKRLAQKNGIVKRDSAFQRASGQINKMLYKAEIEATRRTGNSAGYALLSMVDYPGQGEALVGWETPMYKNKIFITPEEFAMYGSCVVPLLRFDKYVWSTGETFTGNVEISNFGPEDYHDATVNYEICIFQSCLLVGNLVWRTGY